VPAGWSHAVINLEDSVAITQNYVGYPEFKDSWLIVRRKNKALAKRWRRGMAQWKPELEETARRLDERYPDWDGVELSSESEDGVSSSSDEEMVPAQAKAVISPDVYSKSV